MKAKSLLGLLTLLMVTNSYGFCVYNQTVGSDTLRPLFPSGVTKEPTQILFKAYLDVPTAEITVLQNGVLCELTNHREANDSSVVDIKREKYLHNDYGYESNKPICTTTVYNKGGYIVVKGDAKNGFSCETYRD